MERNENGSKRTLIVVNPKPRNDGSARPAKAFPVDISISSDPFIEALEYAHEGDALLDVFEDGTVHRSHCGAKHGAGWGEAIAEDCLYSGLPLDKAQIMAMCNNDDIDARNAFIDALVDFAIERHKDGDV